MKSVKGNRIFIQVSLAAFTFFLFFGFQNLTLPVYTIYISPSGSDDTLADGSASKPYLTLQKALLIATPLAQGTSYSAIQIAIKPGTYLGQYVDWNLATASSGNYINPFNQHINKPIKIPITIESADKYNLGHFQGSGVYPNTTFFNFSYRLGNTRLTIRNIKISNYLTSALALRGSGTDSTKFNSNTTIENVILDKIGSQYVFNNSANYAAFSLINSRDNIIRRNIFSRIDDYRYAAIILDTATNTPKLSQSTGLHAIYASFFSKGNQIYDNSFQNIKSGQVIKIRDQSHDTNIYNNNFLFVGNDLVRNASGQLIQAASRSAVYNWYCDRATNDECSETKIECPNYNTKITNNRVIEEPTVENSTAVGVDKLIYMHWYPKYDPANTLCTADKISAPYNLQATAENPRGTLTGNTNQGCYVSVENCPYMNRQNHYEFADHVSTSHESAANCSARSSGWYNSCLNNIGTQPMMVRTRFLKADAVVSQVVKGHGCVVTASYCPKMGFWENMSKLDWKPETHSSLEVCRGRADDWYNSCIGGMTDQNEINKVKITVEYFQSGQKLGEKKYPGN